MKEALSKTFELSSGFTISVQPLPPYYIDFIEDEFPLEDYPKRKVMLVGGDTVELEYTPPEQMPDADNIEDYELYVKWHAVALENAGIMKLRERARRDFLLSTCVTIVSGPIDIASNEWVQKLEAAMPEGYEVPTHPGKRILAFLKSQVIRSAPEYGAIIQATMFTEATMQGVGDALRGFQNEMGRKESRRRHYGKANSKQQAS